MLKISSRGVSNLEKTKGQYFLSKESYFFTLRQLGCSDTPEPDRGLPALAQGPGLWCWVRSPPAVARGWKLEGPHGLWTSPPPPMPTSGPPPQGLHFHGKGTPKRQRWLWPPTSVLQGGPAARGEHLGRSRDSTTSTYFLSPLCVLPPSSKDIMVLRHSVGDILVKMQYFYVM